MSAKSDLEKFQKQVDAALKELTSPKAMREIGDDAAKRIKVRTRLGKGIAKSNPDGSDSVALKKLSKSYKAQRAGKVAFFTKGKGPKRKVIPYVPDSPPKLHSQTSPNKSNLTRTGEMLDSIKTLSATQGVVEIGITGTHKDGISMEKLVEYVSEERPFLGLTKPERSSIITRFQATLTKLIDKLTK